MNYLLGLTAIAAVVGVMANASMASEHMPYEVTVTNNLDEELLAPVLVAPVSEDGKIFVDRYVSKEAEHQILTGDPAMLVAVIGDEASVGHGMDGPPGVLLAPGKSITFVGGEPRAGSPCARDGGSHHVRGPLRDGGRSAEWRVRCRSLSIASTSATMRVARPSSPLPKRSRPCKSTPTDEGERSCCARVVPGNLPAGVDSFAVAG